MCLKSFDYTKTSLLKYSLRKKFLISSVGENAENSLPEESNESYSYYSLV